jgi:ribonuclease-3
MPKNTSTKNNKTARSLRSEAISVKKPYDRVKKLNKLESGDSNLQSSKYELLPDRSNNDDLNNLNNYKDKKLISNDNEYKYTSLKITDPDYVMTSEDITYRILNDKNILITEDAINAIFDRVGFNYKVKDLYTFQTAMIHESYMVDRLTDSKTAKLIRECDSIDPRRAEKALPLQTRSYERLEFLGDSVIHYALAQYLFIRNPNSHQGFLTSKRSQIEKKESLAKYGRKLGLQKYVMIGYSIEQVNGRLIYDSITEDVFEAFVGALNLEAGIDQTSKFVIKAYEELGDYAEDVRTNDNYKDQLMQHFHKIDPNYRHDLKYSDEDFEDKNGKRKYHTRVFDRMNGDFLGEGVGKSKKEAQQNSAKNALLRIELIGNEDNEDEFLDIDCDIDAELEKMNKW